MRERRPRHRQLATYLKLKAAWQEGERSDRLLRMARRSAQALEDAGWVAPAQDARLIAGRLALEHDRPVIARAELAAASRKPRRGPVELRIRARHAEALLQQSEGDVKRAEHALRSGMRLLEQHRALLGATDLRTHASAHGAELAEMGLRMALRDGTPSGVLEWTEHWRAGSLASRPVRPPDDERLQRELEELRRGGGGGAQAARAGRAARGGARAGAGGGRRARGAKRLGDGVMIAARRPEDGVLVAVQLVDAFAARMAERALPLRLRAGVHRGTSRRQADDYIGHHVNVAARVADAGRGGQVLVSASTLTGIDLTGLGLYASPAGRLRGKGVVERLELLEVGSAPPPSNPRFRRWGGFPPL
jgi:class 3 adenylate cyclase